MEHIAAKQIVRQFPDQAVELIAKCCKYEDILSYKQRGSVENMDDGLHTESNLKTFGPTTPTSAPGAQISSSPADDRNLQNRTPPILRPIAPLSPVTIASSSSKSPRSKNGTQYMIILTSVEGNVEEQPVRMRTAPIANSVICEEVVHQHLSASVNVYAVQEGRITLHCPETSGVIGDTLISSWYTKLTWRRSGSDATHKTTFYLVPRLLLDIDVLLGYRDSGEGLCSRRYLDCMQYQADR